MRRSLLVLLAAGALLAVAALAGVGRPEAARGDTAPQNAVTTLGHGSVTAVPDEATISAGARTDAATAAEALAHNAELMQKVVAALRQAGGDRVQTEEVSLYPQTDEHGSVTGYVAQNTVSARSKIAGSGALVDAAVAAGANTVDGPSLDLSDRDALYRRALAKALDDARAKAETLAQAGGFGIAAVLSVSEQGSDMPVVYQRDAAAPQASTPIEPGTQDVTADVQVTFAIR
jgi:uncharacterized protein YggE